MMKETSSPIPVNNYLKIQLNCLLIKKKKKVKRKWCKAYCSILTNIISLTILPP